MTWEIILVGVTLLPPPPAKRAWCEVLGASGPFEGWFQAWGVFPGGSDCEEPACNAGDSGLILGLRRSPEEGNGNPTLVEDQDRGEEKAKGKNNAPVNSVSAVSNWGSSPLGTPLGNYIECSTDLSFKGRDGHAFAYLSLHPRVMVVLGTDCSCPDFPGCPDWGPATDSSLFRGLQFKKNEEFTIGDLQLQVHAS